MVSVYIRCDRDVTERARETPQQGFGPWGKTRLARTKVRNTTKVTLEYGYTQIRKIVMNNRKQHLLIHP
jgi:hypothetical protein